MKAAVTSISRVWQDLGSIALLFQDIWGEELIHLVLAKEPCKLHKSNYRSEKIAMSITE